MSSQFRFQGLPPVFSFCLVSDLLQPRFHILNFGYELLSGSFTANFIGAFSGFVAEMGETQKIKRIRFAILSFSPVRFMASKTHSSAFVRMYFQSKSFEPFVQRLFDAFRIVADESLFPQLRSLRYLHDRVVIFRAGG